MFNYFLKISVAIVGFVKIYSCRKINNLKKTEEGNVAG